MARKQSSTDTLQFQQVAISELHFDPDNPRIPPTIDAQNETAVLNWMLEDASLADLMASIAAGGYFPGEPVLATPRRKGGYLVVEGNRRLAAVRLLLSPQEAPTKKRSVAELATYARHKPQKLPTLIFPTRAEILQYLGYRHITGVKAWEPLAKARYVRQLFDQMTITIGEERYRELARTIGSGKRADYVARLLTALALYESVAEHGFFEIADLSEDSVKFSFFLVALNHSAIAIFLGINAQEPQLDGLKTRHLKEFVTWCFSKDPSGKTVLGESRNMGRLAAVVARKAALAALRKGQSLAAAEKLTGAPNDVFAEEVSVARDHIVAADTQKPHVTAVTRLTLSHLSDMQTRARQLHEFSRGLLSE